MRTHCDLGKEVADLHAQLKRAGQEDMDLLYVWANDPAVRRNSFHIEKILYEEHKEWYRRLLADPDRGQYLYFRDGTPVGQVRIAAAGEEAEISYSICAEKRGKGYAKEMLSLLRKQVCTDFPDVRYLTAKVKPDNSASQGVFLSLGYQKIYETYRMPCIG